MHTTGEKLLEAVSPNLASSKLRSSCMIPRVIRQKIILWDLEPRLPVLARASSN
jgi:hypothetical protein